MTDDSLRRVLLAGPIPPPVGGIATIVAKLAADPRTAHRFDFFDVTKRGEGFFQLYVVRPLRELLELNRRLRRRPLALFAFSSAYGSFWQKCLWLWLARRHRVPMLVMMVDGRFIDFFAGLPPWRQRLARRALERFGTVIVQSEFWRRFYLGIAPRARCAVVPNGVDCAEFAPASRAQSDLVTVLFVGWLVPEKGVFDLIDAARRMVDAQKRFVLRVVGPWHGNETALRDRVAALGIGDSVQLIGPVNDRAAMLGEYQRADIFTLPSWAEGLPVSVLEAMACELPIVATRVGGVPDLVDSNCGLLVEPRAPAALADALGQLVSDARLRRAFGAASRARVEHSFSTEKFGPGILQIIDEGSL